MSSEFVLGYIQAVDGERDPRNLLTAFHSVYLIIVHLDFGEDVSCCRHKIKLGDQLVHLLTQHHWQRICLKLSLATFLSTFLQ